MTRPNKPEVRIGLPKSAISLGIVCGDNIRKEPPTMRNNKNAIMPIVCTKKVGNCQI